METNDTTKEHIVREARRLADDVEKFTGMGEQEMSRRSRELWEQARSSARDRWRRAQRMSRERGRQVDEFVHENVWTSIGIAAAVGAVMGMMMRKSRRRE